MKPVLSLVLVLVLGLFTINTATGQDSVEDRVGALETRVAELESITPGEPAPAASATSEQSAIPVTAGGQKTVSGNALELLPSGEPGRVVMLASGPLESGYLPVVVRNNTNAAIASPVVKVEARDTAGQLIAVGESSPSQTLKPYLLQPGQVAIGFAYMPGEVPIDTVFSFNVEAEEPPGLIGNFMVDLGINEATWLKDRIVGVASNPSNSLVGGTYMNVVCFTPDGTPTHAAPATMQGYIEPGGTALFQIGSNEKYVLDCEHFLIAATAHPQQ